MRVDASEREIVTLPALLLPSRQKSVGLKLTPAISSTERRREVSECLTSSNVWDTAGEIHLFSETSRVLRQELHECEEQGG